MKPFRISTPARHAVQNPSDREHAETFISFALTAVTDERGDPILDEGGDTMLWPVGAPLSYSEPRRYEIGLRIEF